MASGLNVRGGNTDQNLILIDDVPIYNSSHLFGMYSIIDTRTINNLELYKGGAPAQFGGRASSVMDISLKEGNYKHFEGDGSAGLFSSSLALQGPLVKNKASIIIVGRTTYSDWILKRVPDVDIRHSSANFYDINARLGIILNQKNKLNFYTYMSNDNMDLAGKNEYSYTNKLASLKWNHIFNNKFSVFLASYLSDFKTNTIDKEEPVKAFELINGIRQMGAKIRFLYLPGEKQSIYQARKNLMAKNLKHPMLKWKMSNRPNMPGTFRIRLI
jgi:outer membrane cobalamin receptor